MESHAAGGGSQPVGETLSQYQISDIQSITHCIMIHNGNKITAMKYNNSSFQLGAGEVARAFCGLTTESLVRSTLVAVYIHL